MIVEQTNNRIRVVFSDTAVAREALAENSVVDVDCDRDLVVGVEVACLLSLLKAHGVDATVSASLPPEVSYDPLSDGLYIRLNRDKATRFPVRSVCQPDISTRILLSARTEVIGVEVKLPIDKPWPAFSRRKDPASDDPSD